MFYSENQLFKTYHISVHIFLILLQETRLSSKLMFRAKLHSEILDFSNNVKLLQFQFERWLHKTMSGGRVIFINTLYIFSVYTISLQYLQHFIITVTKFSHYTSNYLTISLDFFYKQNVLLMI